MIWDGTHEDAMRRCGFVLENGDHCYQRTRMKYPGNDPENGPARECCPAGHSTCYRCGKWFQAIVKYEARTEYYDDDDPSSAVEIPAGSSESEICSACEDEVDAIYCACGSDGIHKHDESQCCGGSMCCEKANE